MIYLWLGKIVWQTKGRNGRDRSSFNMFPRDRIERQQMQKKTKGKKKK